MKVRSGPLKGFALLFGVRAGDSAGGFTRPGVRSFATALLLAVPLALAVGCSSEDPAPTPSSGATAGTSTQAPGPATTALLSISGKWKDEKGNVYEFARSGLASFDGDVTDSAGGACKPAKISVSSTSGHYEGVITVYEITGGVCGAPLGEGKIVIDLDASGTTAKATWTAPAGATCTDCGPHTWKKQ